MSTQWKSYAAQTGLVYRYYFVGQRVALADDPEAPSCEYIFDVTADRKTTFAVSIFLSQPALDYWAAHRGRDLTDPEQYAGVKLRLLQAFDESADMMHDGRRLRLEGETLLELLDSIGVD
ncbi:MAG TPA: hypothetical protein VGG15_02740 [Terriglobales bacterium]|jgi:hypothetical protein